MSFRYNPAAKREYWHTIEVGTPEGENVDVNVKYWLLSPKEATAQLERQLSIAKAANDGNGEHVDLMLDQLSDSERAHVRTQLCERIIDWDIEDASANPPVKLPVTADVIGTIYDSDGPLAQALYNGLMVSSRGMASKKTGKRG